jgi:hypothetical protein
MKWYKTTFPQKEFPNWITKDLTIIHNINIDSFHGTLGDAFAIHCIKSGGKAVTAETFAKYINSKTQMSGHRAFTEQEFKRHFPHTKPTYQK